MVISAAGAFGMKLVEESGSVFQYFGIGTAYSSSDWLLIAQQTQVGLKYHAHAYFMSQHLSK